MDGGAGSAEMLDRFLRWLSELELVTVNDGMYVDGYEWYALVT